jgi:hypothetical protein
MKYLSLIISALFILPKVFCQTSELSTISSAGNSKSNGISLTWTLGESFADCKTSGNFKLQEGFHQGDLFILTNTTNLPENIAIDIFPNPVKGILKIKMAGDINSHGWNLEVYSNQGVLLKNLMLSDSDPFVNLSSLPPSAYLIKIFDNQGKYKILTVIKE